LITADNKVPPVLTSVTPSVGSAGGGNTVVLAGSNFDTNGGNTVLFGGRKCNVTVATTTSISCIVQRAGAPGIVDVSVRVEGAGMTEQAVLYKYILSTTSVTPSTSGLVGGVSVTILGQGFLAGSNSDVKASAAFEIPGLETYVVGLYTVPQGSPSGQWRMSLTGNKTEWISTNASAEIVQQRLVDAMPSLLSVDVFVADHVPGQFLNRMYPRQWVVRFSRASVPGLGVQRCTDPRYVVGR
jgi:hypothetical protein